jgi:hydroxymethylbilane synthase
MVIAVWGVDYHVAPIAIREQFAVSPANYAPFLQNAAHSMGATSGISECAIVATCNRTELYCVGASEAQVHAWIHHQLTTLFGAYDACVHEIAYLKHNDEAIQHLLRVATGIESLVFGETQILGQIRNAMMSAERYGTMRQTMRMLFQVALRAGRAAHQHTQVGQHTLSIAHAAVQLIMHNHPIAPQRIGIIGAGEMAQLALKALSTFNGQIIICNRSRDKAEAIAHHHTISVVDWHDRHALLDRCDAVIVAVYADTYVVTPGQVIGPRTIVDISMPRMVDPRLVNQPSVHLFDIDDLHQVTAHNLARRKAALNDVERIISAHHATFTRWQAHRRAAPIITAMRRSAEEIVRVETADALHALSHRTQSTPAIIARLSHRIVRKLLHAPTRALIHNPQLAPFVTNYRTALESTTRMEPHTAKAITIGTRGSALALWQTYHVAQLIQRSNPALVIATKIISTRGDRDLSTPLPSVGGKGVFTEELEDQLRAHTIDLAVHSLKDLPTSDAHGTHVVAIPMRGEVADVLVSRGQHTIHTLPHGATVGTSSTRRTGQLLRLRPDLRIIDIRGNIDSRIAKALDPDSPYDAIVLAHAGLKRLGLEHHISYVFRRDEMVSAPAQGALAIQVANNNPVGALIQHINHQETNIAVTLERAILARLGGGCSMPVAVHARHINAHEIDILARVVTLDGQQCIQTHQHVLIAHPHTILDVAHQIASKLLLDGAQAILDGVHAP